MTNRPRQTRCLVLASPDQSDRILGLHEVPNRLPAMTRWPSEPLEAFLARAAAAASDGPDFWALPVFAR